MALVSAACGDDDDASPATTTIAPTTAALTTAATTTAKPTATVAATTTGAGTAAFEDAACPTPNIPGVPSVDFPTTAKCDYLTVPEDRSKAPIRRGWSRYEVSENVTPITRAGSPWTASSKRR